jgi:putative spermidine/putrescine transport system permease protein
MTAATGSLFRPSNRWRRLFGDHLLLIPAALLFLVVLAVPLLLLLPTSLNPSARGVVGLEPTLTFENYIRLLTQDLYPDALLKSVFFGGVTSVIAVVLGYPVAFVIANTHSIRRLTALTILLLIPFQIDIIVRIFGLITLLGDNGLINSSLVDLGLITRPLPLMYNRTGVLIGTTQFILPFVVFALVGALKTVNPELIQAGRSLGASYWSAFRKIVLPLSLPGIAASALIAFTLTFSDFAIPTVLSTYQEIVLPLLLYQQVTVLANVRFAAAMAVTMLAVSLATVFIGYRLIRRILAAGGV